VTSIGVIASLCCGTLEHSSPSYQCALLSWPNQCLQHVASLPSSATTRTGNPWFTASNMQATISQTCAFCKYSPTCCPTRTLGRASHTHDAIFWIFFTFDKHHIASHHITSHRRLPRLLQGQPSRKVCSSLQNSTTGSRLQERLAARQSRRLEGKQGLHNCLKEVDDSLSSHHSIFARRSSLNLRITARLSSLQGLRILYPLAIRLCAYRFTPPRHKLLTPAT
jgi:hypothetical protein